MGKLVETLVLDAVQAAHADVTLNTDNTISIKGMVKRIPRNSAYCIVSTYTAGTAKIITVQITTAGGGPVGDETYTLRLLKTLNRSKMTDNTPQDNTIETYVAIAQTTSPTATTVAAQLNTAINLSITQKSSSLVTCTVSTDTLTLTMNDAFSDLNVEFQGSGCGVTVTNTTPYVAPVGTPAIVSVSGGVPTAGNTYDQVYISFRDTLPGLGQTGVEESTSEYVLIFANHADGDTAAFTNYLNEVINAQDAIGTATGSALAATLNTNKGAVTTEALTTAAGLEITYVITNSLVKATSIIQVSIANGTNTTVAAGLVSVTPAAGSFSVVITNTHASSALNGTLVINYEILSY